MNVDVELPDLGDKAGDEGTVSEWHFEEGDFVEQDEHLVEVVAGGDTIDVPAPAPGVIAVLSVEEGDLVRVGDVLAIIEVREDSDFTTDEDEE